MRGDDKKNVHFYLFYIGKTFCGQGRIIKKKAFLKTKKKIQTYLIF
jgi:hypothetical protein